MGKLSFVVGVAAGYVLGARAGQQRYEQIKKQANKVWSSGPVQARVSDVTAAAKTKAAPFVADVISDAARTAGEKMRSTATSSEPTSAPTSPQASTPAPAADVNGQPTGTAPRNSPSP
jgi:hypothetical protein